VALDFGRPVLPAAEIRRRLTEAKYVERYRELLSPTVIEGGSAVARVPVFGERGGDFELIARRSKRDEDDWSLICRYDLDGWEYRLLRMNGPSIKAHKNHLTGEVFVSRPHIHYATEAAQRRGLKEDNHAIAVGHLVMPVGGSQAFTTMVDAVEVFARKVHIRADEPGAPRLL
jgi:hypothetical protein